MRFNYTIPEPDFVKMMSQGRSERQRQASTGDRCRPRYAEGPRNSYHARRSRASVFTARREVRLRKNSAGRCRWMKASSLPGWLVLLLLLPLAAGADPTLRVAVISDLNGSYGSTRYDADVDRAVERIIQLRPELVISTGDMVAGQRRPHLTRAELEDMWTVFHAHVSEPLRQAGIPLAVTPGNHDASAYAGFTLEREIFEAQWKSRPPEVDFVDGDAYPFFYAFAVGQALFISLDATVVGKLPDRQMRWLRALLSRHGDDFSRRVVFSHVPLWPLARGREREYIGDPGLQTLLADEDVELYLSGHHHAFYPAEHHGIAFVGQSCLGAGPRPLIGTDHRSSRSFTILEVGPDTILVSAYRAPEFDDVIDWTTLPERVRSPAAELLRADLATASAIGPGVVVQ